jgi:hypothetical protein
MNDPFFVFEPVPGDPLQDSPTKGTRGFDNEQDISFPPFTHRNLILPSI